MASNLGCVGLAVDDSAGLSQLVQQVLPLATTIGELSGISVRRWQDPSGSRLILGLRGTEIVDVLPSFAASSGARLGAVTFLSDEVASASVLDEDGEQMTALTLELEERQLLRASSPLIGGRAAMTALGVEVEVFASADEFSASEASLVSPRGETESEPPAHFVAKGWKWPPRVGPESFISYGAFADPDNASAHARLAGTVLDARAHQVQLTGQRFIEARVRTVGFDAHVCFPGEDTGLPSAGNIVHGTVFLVGSIEASVGKPRRRRLFRR